MTFTELTCFNYVKGDSFSYFLFTSSFLCYRTDRNMLSYIFLFDMQFFLNGMTEFYMSRPIEVILIFLRLTKSIYYR